jgi:DNA-binding transcriptional regulator YiaG
MASGPQIRAARALLGMSAQDLARLSEVGWATIQRYEANDGVPKGQADKLKQVVRALEDAGVEFLGDPISSPGVRLRV